MNLSAKINMLAILPILLLVGVLLFKDGGNIVTFALVTGFALFGLKRR